MAGLDFAIFDADNHYYEAEEAFTRHIDPRMKRRAIEWAMVDGRKTLLVAGKVNRFIPNPTFDPVAKPGCLEQYYRGHNPKNLSMRELFGQLEPIHRAYRERDERLRVMDAQGIERSFLFPTLGVGMEEALRGDPEALCAAFHAFNAWLAEDWGFAWRERLYGAPMISLVDPAKAVAELEWVLARKRRECWSPSTAATTATTSTPTTGVRAATSARSRARRCAGWSPPTARRSTPSRR